MMAMIITPLSFPKIMGMGPMSTIPPVLTSSPFSVFPVLCRAVPRNISIIPKIMADVPMKIRLSAFIFLPMLIIYLE